MDALIEMIQDTFEDGRVGNTNYTNVRCCCGENLPKNQQVIDTPHSQRVIIATLRAWIGFRLDSSENYQLESTLDN